MTKLISSLDEVPFSLTALKNLPGLVVCTPDDAEQIAGRRSFIDYLDYGINAAADGAISFQRMTVKDGMDTETGWHYHTIDAQITFILEGWVEARFEDGVVRHAPKGSAFLVPGLHRHNELRMAPGSEVLELVIGQMGTVACDAPEGLEIACDAPEGIK